MAALLAVPGVGAAAQPIASVAVASVQTSDAATFEGTVEAVRQAVLAAQVPGTVVQLQVKAGDHVRAGQVVARIDARAAEQGAAASAAQASAARASLDVARQELERKRALYARQYIAKAALEAAEGQFRAAQAQHAAQLAQTQAAQAQTGFHVVRAPFDGVIASVQVEQGDMAMPGRPLMTVFDPSSLRVTAAVPAAALTAHAKGAQLRLSGREEAVAPVRVQVLPTIDPATLTQQVRADLPAGLSGIVPGQFARIVLPGAAAVSSAPARVFIPTSAVIRRAELVAVMVLSGQDRPVLRQVRLGPVQGAQVEVLSGLAPGERVVAEPRTAQAKAPAGR
ncbi:efflux RND transporter periplasmic adaptor subunit [Ottowia sp. GY511]|uniref:Efflux RND transporter periplasmic adaptor subunit n=1 Tax=Ottowia flava TaxID=2675430 RepID=A0ABW4KPJ0_9BURK|nr:efflux RND transporter periplasmic adaptor subunit [Ottowia sp. GY511]TXK24893.1 efflux RND transporter periplasmic adaptor subunit [Ottowia sp. GY511]